MNNIFYQRCEMLKYTGSFRSIVQMILSNEKPVHYNDDMLIGHKSVLILNYLFP